MSVILGIFFGVVFFTVQGMLCIKASSLIIKLIPTAVIALGLFVCIGFESTLVSIFSATAMTICAVGDGMAWLVYYLIIKRK